MSREFAGHEVGALRNTSGSGGITVRLLDFQQPFTDDEWKRVATALGLSWDRTNRYLVLRYPAAKESVNAVTGRIALDITPPQPFRGAVFADWVAAEDQYISDCAGGGKTRRRWAPGFDPDKHPQDE